MKAEGKPAPTRQPTIQDEVRQHTQTLIKKWRRAGRRIPDDEQIERVIAFAYLSLLPMQTGHYRFLECGAASALAQTYWAYPDFTQELLSKVRKAALKRDSIDVALSQIQNHSLCTDEDIATHIKQQTGVAVTLDAVKRRRQRLLRKMAQGDENS